jgi:hypothetical protein
MTGRFLIGVSQAIFVIAMWAGYFWIKNSDLRDGSDLWENAYFWIFLVLGVAGVFLQYVGLGIHWTKESGLWNKICEKTSIWQRMTGDIPSFKSEQVPPPFLRKRTGLIIGISSMIFGIVISTILVLLKVSYVFMNFFIVSISAFIMGLLLIFFSFAYLDKGRYGKSELFIAGKKRDRS